jgi:hypothetical protein
LRAAGAHVRRETLAAAAARETATALTAATAPRAHATEPAEVRLCAPTAALAAP